MTTIEKRREGEKKTVGHLSEPQNYYQTVVKQILSLIFILRQNVWGGGPNSPRVNIHIIIDIIQFYVHSSLFSDFCLHFDTFNYIFNI